MKQKKQLFTGQFLGKGYRLHKLEVFNWGTFDGQVFSVQPTGKSALLIGQNGSGKSTLVDALLTLLVKPGVRNFNVAAGAKKRERDERTYLRGAYDRGSDEAGLGIQVKYLRPRGDQYSVILACFRNTDTGKVFTIAQFLYLSTDQSVEKIYCFAEEERSIQDDFGGLESSDSVFKTLKLRGFRVTRKFQEYEGWFTKITRVRPKAMEVFNQTVAVKDIQKLNDFIRDHMLEQQSSDEKVDSLLAHFNDLNQAHDSLVRVRQQFELLDPVARIGAEYQDQALQLETAERLLAAAPIYFSQRTLDIFTPALERSQAELKQTKARKQALDEDISATRERGRQLQSEIERAGGDRLRQIPLLIEREQAFAESKRQTQLRHADAVGRLGLSKKCKDAAAFDKLQEQLPKLRVELDAELNLRHSERDTLVLQRGEVIRTLKELRHELQSLSQRRDNIPEWSVSLRQAICEELGLAPRDLPFAAELMQVDPREQSWEASIEKVLHGFALSLLVPDKFYHVVSRHVDSTRLTAQGRGQRLVYLRVAEQAPLEDGTVPPRQSLFRKLKFREGHDLLPWIKAELQHRFDYVCCETIEEFHRCRGQAMTRNRHVKSGNQRHEKDDRDHVSDPRNFVLGWDNRDKKQRIAAEIQTLAEKEQRLDLEIAKLEKRLAELRDRLAAIVEAQRVTSFSDIDSSSHEREIDFLEKERKAIEAKSDAIKVLKQHLADAVSHEQALQQRVYDLAGDERELDNQIAQAKRLINNNKAELARLDERALKEAQQVFPDLDAKFTIKTLTTENLFESRERFREQQDAQIIQLRKVLDPVRDRLLELMNRFLSNFPERASDLRPTIDYLSSFLAVRQQIIDDDLPRHEQRFKERLNQKVIEEIGLFWAELSRQRREIQDKIELLNNSLKKLEYRPGTHIQLEPRPIHDPEIVEFQSRLRECGEGLFEDTPEANETRFLRIKDLVVKLRDESNRRWRDKVIDVRRWFDFVASVIDRQTTKTVSIYQDSSGQSGGEKAKLAFTILVAAIAYQYDLEPDNPSSDRFHFVVVDEMFSKVDDQHALYAMELFQQFGLQLLIVAPLDAKAKVTQSYVGCYLHVTKKDNRSAIYEMTAKEFEESLVDQSAEGVKMKVPR